MPDYCFTSDEERKTQKFDVQVTDWLPLRMRKNRETIDSVLRDLAQIPHCIVKRSNGKGDSAAVFKKNRFIA